MSYLMKKVGEINRIIFGRQKIVFGGAVRNASCFNGSNANYIDEMYELWRVDSGSVHKSWDVLFKAAEKGLDLKKYFQSPPTIAFSHAIYGFPQSATRTTTPPSTKISSNIAVCNLIHAYQSHGHTLADINPLGPEFACTREELPELTLSHWGLRDEDLENMFVLPSNTYIGGGKQEMLLKDIIVRLREVYTKSIGIEYAHIEDHVRVDWIKRKIECIEHPLSSECRIEQLERVSKAALFEAFLAKKFPSEKRFGLEGCDTLIPFLQAVVDQSSTMGVDNFVMGMAHRGRLNVLANVCQQPLEYIFTRFNDELQMEDQGSGDVKYHLGVSNMRRNTVSGRDVRLTMVANPSHLEAVDPVVKGKVKAEQHMRNDDGSKVQCLLIHGDAAFCGQGIVYETMNLAELPSYSVGGTIHVVTNNQIGFTTNPKCSRSSRYCSDVAKVGGSPVFHVNADDPEAVFRVAVIAAEYRNTFKKDVVVDIIGYRRNGHNEGDNPGFTQPHMYKAISARPNVMELYARKLIETGVLSADASEKIRNAYETTLVNEFEKARQSTVLLNNVWIDSPWKSFFKADKSFSTSSTGVSIEQVIEYQRMCCRLPDNFTLNPAIQRIMSGRLELLEARKMDWAMGEIAAFSTLLAEGVHVRLSGQDSERGTFSHRHHVLHDTVMRNKTYTPLCHISTEQAAYSVSNSSLSEYAVVGFEHGYSMSSPHFLTIWEGQFGDFANTAQCIIDQFIASGEDKWIRQSGMVLLLPHGYDGMGPEHSSARLERFLQLTKEDPDIMPSYAHDEYEARQIYHSNYVVAYPTTPANLFHLLRRQFSFNFRKPLIVMSPKNLLRHELARSSFNEIGPGSSFQRLIPETGAASQSPLDVKRLIFCSGKLYYELLKNRKSRGVENTIAIARIEQISPFPWDLISNEIEKYPNAELMYAQEEPKNQGAYYHVKPMITLAAKDKTKLIYCGRVVSTSPATGSKYQHNIEQNAILNDALDF